MVATIGRWSKNYTKKVEELINGLDSTTLEKVAKILWQAYQKRNKIFLIGNGGSAAIAAHMACDLSKTVKGHKGDGRWEGFKAISLTDNIPLITAWSNDVNYQDAYAQQLENLAAKNDILIAFSSSGSSPNIIRCAKVATRIGMQIISISGFGGGKLPKLADAAFTFGLKEYGPIEDIQHILSHILVFYFYEKLKELNK